MVIDRTLLNPSTRELDELVGQVVKLVDWTSDDRERVEAQSSQDLIGDADVDAKEEVLLLETVAVLTSLVLVTCQMALIERVDARD